LTEYVNELTKSDLCEYFRPNFWPNTPDINPIHLQGANESKYLQRYVLAATLSSNVGLYGPVFEQMISEPIQGKEEYLNSEKFQICEYDWSIENNITSFITDVNNIRNAHPALQQTNNIKFCNINNENLIAYYKWNDAKTSEILIIVSLNNFETQQGMIQLPKAELAIDNMQNFTVTDLLTNNTFKWKEEWNFVELQPSLPCHILKINR